MMYWILNIYFFKLFSYDFIHSDWTLSGAFILSTVDSSNTLWRVSRMAIFYTPFCYRHNRLNYIHHKIEQWQIYFWTFHLSVGCQCPLHHQWCSFYCIQYWKWVWHIYKIFICLMLGERYEDKWGIYLHFI